MNFTLITQNLCMTSNPIKISTTLSAATLKYAKNGSLNPTNAGISIKSNCVAVSLLGARARDDPIFNVFWDCYLYRSLLSSQVQCDLGKCQNDELIVMSSFMTHRNVIIIKPEINTFQCYRYSVSNVYDIIVYSSGCYRYLPTDDENSKQLFVQFVTLAKRYISRYVIDSNNKSNIEVEFNKSLLKLRKTFNDRYDDLVTDLKYGKITKSAFRRHVSDIKTHISNQVSDLVATLTNMINTDKSVIYANMINTVNEYVDHLGIYETSNSLCAIRNEVFNQQRVNFEIERRLKRIETHFTNFVVDRINALVGKFNDESNTLYTTNSTVDEDLDLLVSLSMLQVKEDDDIEYARRLQEEEDAILAQSLADSY